MLDNPEKTTRLLTALKAALPFEVELTSSAIAHLRAQQIGDNVKPKQIVSKVSYGGDEGGIFCHLEPEETEKVIIDSPWQYDFALHAQAQMRCMRGPAWG